MFSDSAMLGLRDLRTIFWECCTKKVFDNPWLRLLISVSQVLIKWQLYILIAKLSKSLTAMHMSCTHDDILVNSRNKIGFHFLSLNYV